MQEQSYYYQPMSDYKGKKSMQQDRILNTFINAVRTAMQKLLRNITLSAFWSAGGWEQETCPGSVTL